MSSCILIIPQLSVDNTPINTLYILKDGIGKGLSRRCIYVLSQAKVCHTLGFMKSVYIDLYETNEYISPIFFIKIHIFHFQNILHLFSRNSILGFFYAFPYVPSPIKYIFCNMPTLILHKHFLANRKQKQLLFIIFIHKIKKRNSNHKY